MARAAAALRAVGTLAVEEWQRRYPNQLYATVWSIDECASALAHARINPGRRLKKKAGYVGYQSIDCPYGSAYQSLLCAGA